MFTEELNQFLYVLGHFFFRFSLIQVTQINVWEGCCEELDVERVSEEEVYVIHSVFKANVLQGLITQRKNALLYLFVSEVVFFVLTFKGTGLIRFFLLCTIRLFNVILDFLIARKKMDDL